MRSVTAEEMRRLDERTATEFLIPTLLLMENAGRSVADHVRAHFSRCSVVFLIGAGNNGGDGLVAARYLHQYGFSISILLLSRPEQFKGDALINFQIASRLKLSMTILGAGHTLVEIVRLCGEGDLLIDAIFGTGLSRTVEGIYETAIQAMNQSGKPVVSIDIPSGLHADTGETLGVAVQAQTTITLALPKKGLTLLSGPKTAGKIEIVDIGIPREILQTYLE